MNTFAKTLFPFGLILLSGCESLEPGYSYTSPALPNDQAYSDANQYGSSMARPQITVEKTAGILTPARMPYQYTLSYRITVSNHGQYMGNYTLTDTLNFPGTLINSVSIPRHDGPDPLDTFIESSFIGQGDRSVLISNETIAPESSESFNYTVTFTVNDTYLAGTCPTTGLFSETALSGYAQDHISTCASLDNQAYSAPPNNYNAPGYDYSPSYYNSYPPSVWSSESYYLWPSYQYENRYYGRPHHYDRHDGKDHHPPHQRPDTHFNPPTRIIETQRPALPMPVPSRFVEEPRPVRGQTIITPNRPAIRTEPAQLMPQPPIIRNPPTPQPRQEMPQPRMEAPTIRREPAPQPRMEAPTIRREPTPQPRMEAPAIRREPTPQPRMEAPAIRREPTPQPRMEAPTIRREPAPQPRMEAPTIRREPAPQPRMEAPRPPANNPSPAGGNRKGK